MTIASNKDVDPSGDEPEQDTPETVSITVAELEDLKLKASKHNYVNVSARKEIQALKEQIAEIEAKDREKIEKSGDYEKQLNLTKADLDKSNQRYLKAQSLLNKAVVKNTVLEKAKDYTTLSDALYQLVKDDLEVIEGDDSEPIVVTKGRALSVEELLKSTAESKLPGTAPNLRKPGTGVINKEEQTKTTESLSFKELEAMGEVERVKKLAEEPKLRAAYVKYKLKG